jgi:ketosteroid isomerase-like protein
MRYLILVLVAGCYSSGDVKLQREVVRIMAIQEDAWSAGNIDGFMEYYHSDVCFLSDDGQSCGKDLVTRNYKRSYPDSNAMGTLAFNNWEIRMVGESAAWVSGTWTLFRTADTLDGRYSLLWLDTDEGWRIFRDHSDISCD